MMDDLESAEFSISLIGNSVIDLPFGLMALKGNEGKSGENWRAFYSYFRTALTKPFAISLIQQLKILISKEDFGLSTSGEI